MGTSKLVLGALLSALCLTGCNEKPQFVVKLSKLDPSFDTLFVNSTLLQPNRGPGGPKEITFDLKPYSAAGSFDFGLTLDIPSSDSETHRTGSVEMAFVSAGCVRKIVSVHLDGNFGVASPIVTVEVPLTADPKDGPKYTDIPIDGKQACYQMRRPLITALQREITGPYGAPKTTLVVYGWGLLGGTTAKAQLALARPLDAACTAAMISCSTWDQSPDLPIGTGEQRSTTRLPVDIGIFTNTLSPLLRKVGSLLPAVLNNLSFLAEAKPGNMSTAIFPFKVTVTTTVDGKPNTDTFSEYP